MSAAPRHRTAAPLLLAALAAACASSEPADMSLGAVDETIDVTMLGGGFVDAGGRRVPRETFVLDLRQRTRELPGDKKARIRVDLRMRRDAGDDAGADSSWLLDQLQIMGVGQGRLLLGS
jgi:hypothetical protein